MATRKGIVKKTPLSAYGRPMKRGIIAIKIREGDEVVDIAITKPGDEIMLATAGGMAIRFPQEDLRALSRGASGVKGITLRKLSTGEPDYVVGMVVADPEATLLTACEHGYGKRTWFGPNAPEVGAELPEGEEENGPEEEAHAEEAEPEENGEEAGEGHSSGNRYRTQHRGGKGIRDIKTSTRNGRVVAIARVDDTDEVLMMTARGKVQRIRASDISVIGRNTQGVKIMTLDEDDTLAAVVRVPKEENGSEEPADQPAAG
jgi:DNA gyrase subunit A